ACLRVYSYGWQDLSRSSHLTQQYQRAENGNVALTGEIDLNACGGEFVLALGLGGGWAEGAQLAGCSLLDHYAVMQREFIAQWAGWQRMLAPLDRQVDHDLYRAS